MFSVDLRKRILEAYIQGRTTTYEKTAEVFGVGRAGQTHQKTRNIKDCNDRLAILRDERSKLGVTRSNRKNLPKSMGESPDAAGCPTKIATQILEHEADDILAVKNKQPGLAKVVRESFESSDEQEQTKDLVDFCETQDEGYGRTEIRRCTVLKTDSNHPLPPTWESVAAMIRIESERSEGGKTTPHTRYFISSTWINAKDFLAAIRQHWSIENRLHWVLEVAFRADDSRLRAEKAAENFIVLKHMVLNLLQNVKDSKVGIKIRRFEAACNDRFLLNILASCPNSMRLPWGESDGESLAATFSRDRKHPATTCQRKSSSQSGARLASCSCPRQSRGTTDRAY